MMPAKLLRERDEKLLIWNVIEFLRAALGDAGNTWAGQSRLYRGYMTRKFQILKSAIIHYASKLVRYCQARIDQSGQFMVTMKQNGSLRNRLLASKRANVRATHKA